MTMLITVSSSVQPAPTRHHLAPPPTLPKPGKDNLRLQRLLRKAAKKNAVLAAEQAKAFRSSLSPVNEASPDLEHDEDAPQEEAPEATAAPSAGLPAQPPVRPVLPRICSPFRRSKPFALKVTEQRRIAEHVLLTASSAMPLLQRPAAAQQPAGTDTHLPAPHHPSGALCPQPPPPSSPPSNEQVPEVTCVTQVHTYFHSFKPPRAKTPTPNQAQGSASREDRRPFSPAPETSCSEPSPEQIPTPLDDSKATAPALEPVIFAAGAEPPHQAPNEESIKPPSPKPRLAPTEESIKPLSPKPKPAPTEESIKPLSPKPKPAPTEESIKPLSPKPKPAPTEESIKPPSPKPKPAPTEESIKPPSPKPKPSHAHANKPLTHRSDAETPASATAPELPKQDHDTPNPPAPWRQAHPATAPPAQAGSTRATSTGTQVEADTQLQPTPSLPKTSPPLKAEPALSAEAAEPPGAGAGGWRRLRKHLMVQPEPPSFPEPEVGKLSQEEGSKEKDDSQAVVSQDCKLLKSKATRMWDAILYQITLGKKKQQQQRAEEKQQRKEENLFLPRRLPILLHKPRFDARKLKELAAKPMTKISTVFEVSRFRPEGAERHTKSFNRTASGWSVN